VIPADVLDEAVRRLVAAAQPMRIILFGSHARGDATEDSDFDLLVVLKEVTRPRAEVVRLLDVLRPLRLPVEILLYSEEQVFEWGHLPGTVLYEALAEGKVLYEAA